MCVCMYKYVRFYFTSRNEIKKKKACLYIKADKNNILTQSKYYLPLVRFTADCALQMFDFYFVCVIITRVKRLCSYLACLLKFRVLFS